MMPDDFASQFEAAKKQLQPDTSNPLGMLQASLGTNDKGVPHSNVDNVLLCLALNPELQGLLGFNEFLEEPQILAPPPRMQVTDRPAPGPYPRAIRAADIIAIQAYVQRQHLARVTRQTVEDAVYTDAERNRFHPVRQYLDGLSWDGKPRLGHWLRWSFGAEDTPYTREVGAKILIAAVRRIRQPGCKFDTMLILEGLQGAGKSQTVRALFGDAWFTDALPPNLLSKDGSQSLLGVWGVEFAEIEHLIRTDTESLKAFLSRPTERFRPPYGRSFITRGRECVFIGTTNQTDYLRDTTGNRRFWPVACQFASPQWVREVRDQLWAEAAHREAAGEIIWLEEEARELAIEQQAERLAGDVWEDRVRKWLDEQRGLRIAHVTVGAVLSDGLGIDAARMGKKEEMRAAGILAKEGLVRKQVRVDGKPRWIWKWPE
ncbi:DNA primase [Rhodovarius crocodyli]|uniref:DNA primase n=1 Tax=Rhodovarius crocodyli TaxID=1979269 RepID=A0A437MC64_9PROT|nr:virulence-associated E family protein [Rhodovarius crocodyli]RVT95229.1 DNA primase [Rhodovarius crocodyli]